MSNDTESREHLMKFLNKGIRYDGRGLTEYRKVTVEYDVTRAAEGSARVRIGNTEVLAGVKTSLAAPYPDTPDQGNLSVNAELLPLSSPRFESGPPGEQATEVARLADRGIRESKAINVKELCITPGELAWSVMIDVMSINDEGNLLDAASVAAIAALRDAKFPAVVEGKIDYLKKTDKAIPLKETPIGVSVIKIGPHLLVDPLTEEEDEADARMTIATKSDGNLCALQKGGSTPLTPEEIDQMVGIAQEKGEELRKCL